MQASRIRTTAETFFAIHLISTAGFLAHRAITWDALGYAWTEAVSATAARTFLVGALSDFWVATLLATLGSLLTAAFPGIGWLVTQATAALLSGLLAMHDVYVRFFGFPVIPFHLRYMTDGDFVSANLPSLFSAGALVTAAVPLLVLIVLQISNPVRSVPERRNLHAAAMAIVIALGLAAHNRNIHYRVQWFIDSRAQTNAAENLYIRWKSTRPPLPLTASEWDHLAAKLAPWQPEKTAHNFADLARAAFSRSIAEPHPVIASIRDRFRSLNSAGQKPALVVALLESLRPAETGYFSSSASASLTPNLDDLSRSSVVFRRAYSTSSVTRGGQEAVLCGFPGGRDTSLMRGLSVIRKKCLTSAVIAGGSGRNRTFWIHGGDGRFDSQEQFWKSQQVQYITSRTSFGQAAGTSWGTGDLAVFRHAAGQLRDWRSGPEDGFSLGMILSVTNHIPWQLPGDAPVFPDALHPSYLTTRYTDHALGEFVSELKSSGSWDSTLLVVVSDHGNLVPPFKDLYANPATRNDQLMSHINLVLTGGIIDHALAKNARKSLVSDAVTSQAAVSALLAWVTGHQEILVIGSLPLSTSGELPVFSDLESTVYFPSSDRSYDRDSMLSGETVPGPDDVVPALWYRAFMEFVWSGFSE